MDNSSTPPDRRDVSHHTNPLAGNLPVESEAAIPPTEPRRPSEGHASPSGQPAEKELLADTDIQRPNLPAEESDDEGDRFEQPVEGFESKMRINPETGLPERIEPDP